MRYWLMKSEPSTFAITDLQQRPHQTEHWDGVRNYQVRNMMRAEMCVGDKAFFYHSSCKVPGIVGTVEIVSHAAPDLTAFDPQSHYFDPTSDLAKPRWLWIDVKLRQVFTEVITLNTLRQQPALADMWILRKGNRLSITPLTALQWQTICALAE